MYFKLQFPHICNSGDGCGHFHDENAGYGLKIGRRGKATLIWCFTQVVKQFICLGVPVTFVQRPKICAFQMGKWTICKLETWYSVYLFVITLVQESLKSATHSQHYSLPQNLCWRKHCASDFHLAESDARLWVINQLEWSVSKNCLKLGTPWILLP